MSEEARAPLPDPSARRSGGCQCGAVRFAVLGTPEEVSVCHCRMCQKASGGPVMAFARFPAAAVTWTRGQPSGFESSNVVTRGFCAACGTPLTYRWRDDAVSFTVAAFDDPAALVPTKRYGIEGLLPWAEHIAQLPTEMTDDWFADDDQRRFVNHQHPDHDT